MFLCLLILRAVLWFVFAERYWIKLDRLGYAVMTTPARKLNSLTHWKLVSDHSRSLWDSGKLSRDAILRVVAQWSGCRISWHLLHNHYRGRRACLLNASPWKQIHCHCPFSTLARTSHVALPDSQKAGRCRLLMAGREVLLSASNAHHSCFYGGVGVGALPYLKSHNVFLPPGEQGP